MVDVQISHLGEICSQDVAEVVQGNQERIGHMQEARTATMEAVGDPRTPKPGQRLALLNLPTEILEKIFRLVQPKREDGDIGNRNITVQRADGSRSGRKFRNLRRYPAGISELHGLLKWCPEARNLVGALLGRDFLFHSSEFEPMTRIHMVLGRASCSMIHTLEVHMDTVTRMKPDEIGSDLLQVFCTYMPNLTDFKLMAGFYGNGEPCSKKRQHKLYAPVLRFMAFLVLRHSNLDRLVRPADSGPDFDDQEHGYAVYLQAERGYKVRRGDGNRVWNSIDKPTDATRTTRATFRDEVANTTAVRRVTSNKLQRTSIETFFITPAEGQLKDDVFSETPEPNDDFDLVDERGLRTRQEHRLSGWTYRNVDQLIKLCANAEAKAVAVSEARKNCGVWESKGRRAKGNGWRGQGAAGASDLQRGRGGGRGGHLGVH
ncbi:hypothetical protein OHC33_009495 [Knufia fluminis]|uniref:Uncharacterized protein n=1 Tax=Knufia fluminis TaxID=191047 RepID=A0AAN8I1P3_9EURO|nr:hypothetical protein OHC33_009495 [Knufia fluminis]